MKKNTKKTPKTKKPPTPKPLNKTIVILLGCINIYCLVKYLI